MNGIATRQSRARLSKAITRRLTNPPGRTRLFECLSAVLEKISAFKRWTRHPPDHRPSNGTAVQYLRLFIGDWGFWARDARILIHIMPQHTDCPVPQELIVPRIPSTNKTLTMQ